MLIIYSIVSLIGNAGKALAVIILVLQISTTGGIYPVYVMDSFFQAINPWLPMTYGITMLRESLLGVVWSNYITALISLAIFAVVVCIISIVVKEKLDKKAQSFDNALIDSGLF